jgi:hypothetical protein
MIFSELESDPGEMIPLSSTSAVCRPSFPPGGDFQSIASSTATVM